MTPSQVPWFQKKKSQWILIGIFVLIFFSFRLAFGLIVSPLQPIVDEIQTYLIGLKYYTTGAWPYYGNDVITPPDNVLLLTQDPGALEGLIVGLPLRLWHSPLAPIVALNFFSFAGFSFLAFYACKRLPRLSPWFIFPWVLTAPWCVHYSTSMVNLSYTITIGCFFFVTWMESMPVFSLNWIPLPWANIMMGFFLSAWFQLHRTWILTVPFVSVTFFLQWKASRKLTGFFSFILSAIPLSLLIVPTLFQNTYHFGRDVNGFSYGFNMHNFHCFFNILGQFLALSIFEMPRFIGHHTADRIHYLLDHPLLMVPGFFLWYYGILQVLILLGYLFDSKNPHPEWKWVRLLLIGTFLFIFGCLIFTVKTPDVNTFCEMLPIPMIYSLYVWERWWANRRGRLFLQFFLAMAIFFQVAYMFVRLPLKESFYLAYHDKLIQAVEQRDYHILGERRPGSFY